MRETRPGLLRRVAGAGPFPGGGLVLLLLACAGGPDSRRLGPERPLPPAPPAYRVQPVGAQAFAAAGTSPEAVYDYDSAATFWCSGEAPPQRIVLDLGSPRPVAEVWLTARWADPPATRHVLSGGPAADALQPLGEVAGATREGEVLVATFAGPSLPTIRYLAVETPLGPPEVCWGRIEVWALPTHRPEYFGYYADAFDGMTPATAQVADHVNLSWVGGSLADMPTLLARLEEARRRGLAVALAFPQEVFFEADLTLAPQRRAAWDAFADQIEPALGNIAFLYPVDEPYSQGKLAGATPQQMKDRLEEVASTIGARFPGAPIAFTYSAIDFDTQDSAFSDLANPMPAGFSWFGFDCYGSWTACGDPDYRSVHPIPWYLDRLKAALGAGQRLFLFSDAFVRSSQPPDAGRDAAEAQLRVTRARQYYQLAVSEPAIVGLFAFLYQDDYAEDGQTFLGVGHWPELRATYRELGAALTGK